MKKIVLSAFALMSFATAMAQQSFTGFTGGYYSGTLKSLQNPANIVGASRKWDVNLVSLDAKLNNNVIEFDFKNFKESFDKFSDLNTYKNFSGNINVDVVSPSFSLQINEKNAVALTTRTRGFVGIDKFDVKFFETLIADAKDIKNLPHYFNIRNQSININLLSDVGLSWSGVVFQENNHTIKVGATAKYVMGFMNTGVTFRNFNGNLDFDATDNKIYVTAKGDVEAINSGTSLENFKVEDMLKNRVAGFGGDIGVVYEYRENPEDKVYRLKAGAAVTDIGSLTYTPVKNEAYIFHLNNERIDIDDIDALEKNLSVARSQVEGKPYKVSLPTAIRSNVDVRVINRVFVELSGLWGISKDDKKGTIPYYVNEVTLTPRFENKYFGVYVPMTYNETTRYNAGLGLRLGPLFVGSSSILSSALNGKSKEMNVFFGLRFGR